MLALCATLAGTPARAQRRHPWIVPDLLTAAKAEGNALDHLRLHERGGGVPLLESVRGRDRHQGQLRAHVGRHAAVAHRGRTSARASAPGIWSPPRRSTGSPTTSCSNSTRRRRRRSSRKRALPIDAGTAFMATTTRRPTTPISSRPRTCRRPMSNSSITRNGPARSRSTPPIPNGSPASSGTTARSAGASSSPTSPRRSSRW